MENLKILYVDDMPNSSLIERFDLRYPNTRVVVATDLDSALNEFDQSGPFKLIICDGNLSNGKTGLMFYERIKSRFLGNFILFSGDNNLIDQAKGLKILTVSKGRTLTLFEEIKRLKLL